MTRAIDAEGVHAAALRRHASFGGARVLEVGCGDGRLTVPIAEEAAHVFAFDADAEEVATARATLPERLRTRVEYRVASAQEVDLQPCSFELAVLSWSLC